MNEPTRPYRNPPSAAGAGPGQSSARVIRSYLVISGLYTLSASLIWGVNTLFLLNAGLDIFGVFIANGVFTASMSIFEIPTGVWADSRGRRTSFLLSVAVVFAGTLGYVATASLGGGSLLLFSVMSVLLGLGFTFYSGAVEAWLVDALRATGYTGQLDQVFARASMVSGAAMLAGTVSGGILGSLDLAAPFLTRAVLLVSPRAVQLAALPAEMRRIAQASIVYGWRVRSVRLLVVASFIQMGFMAWGFHAWQPYFLDLLGRDAVWVAGVIASLVALATIVGNGVVEWFTRYCGRRTTLLVCAAALFSTAAVGVGLAGSFWLAVGLYLLVMGSVGVYRPVKQAYLHQVIPSEQRATVISFDSLVANGGGVLGQIGLGYVAQTRSIALGYVVGGLAALLALPVIILLRRLGEQTDIIIGTAGSKGGCAGQGLPEVSYVDTTPRTPAGVKV
jgi:MFS family permease